MLASGQDSVLLVLIDDRTVFGAFRALYRISGKFLSKLLDFVAEILSDCFPKSLILLDLLIHHFFQIFSPSL